MTFSSNNFITEELREAFVDLIQNEITARDPAEGAELLYSDEPVQLSFNFSVPKSS